MKYQVNVLPLILSLSAASATASTPASADVRHAAYVELGGAAVAASANYELQPNEHLALRAGLAPDGRGVTFPVGASALIGASPHKLELGAAVLVGKPTYLDGGETLWSPSIGWRYTSDTSGLLLRATFTPLVQFGNTRVLPWGGVSAGLRF